METGSMGLGAVLYKLQVIFFRKLHNRIHLGCLTVKMHDQNSLGTLCDLLLQLCGIYIKEFIRLYKNGSCPIYRDSHDAGDVSISLDKHLISRSNSQNTKGNPQRVQTAGQTYAVGAARISGKFLLKALYLISQHIPAGTQYLQSLILKFLLVSEKSPIHAVCHNLHISSSKLFSS